MPSLTRPARCALIRRALDYFENSGHATETKPLLLPPRQSAETVGAITDPTGEMRAKQAGTRLKFRQRPGDEAITAAAEAVSRAVDTVADTTGGARADQAGTLL